MGCHIFLKTTFLSVLPSCNKSQAVKLLKRTEAYLQFQALCVSVRNSLIFGKYTDLLGCQELDVETLQLSHLYGKYKVTTATANYLLSIYKICRAAPLKHLISLWSTCQRFLDTSHSLFVKLVSQEWTCASDKGFHWIACCMWTGHLVKDQHTVSRYAWKMSSNTVFWWMFLPKVFSCCLKQK